MGKLIYVDELREAFSHDIMGGLNWERILREAKPVDAVPVRHGRWIDLDSETYTWKIRCSKCGHERSMMSTGQTYPMYCEDCGALMDGKDGDNAEGSV